MNGINWNIYLNPTAEYKWYSNKIVYYPVFNIYQYVICPLSGVLLDPHFYCGGFLCLAVKATFRLLQLQDVCFCDLQRIYLEYNAAYY